MMGKKVDSRIVQNVFLGSAVWFCGVSDLFQIIPRTVNTPSLQTLIIDRERLIDAYDVGLALETSFFRIFLAGSSTFTKSCDKTEFSYFTLPPTHPPQFL